MTRPLIVASAAIAALVAGTPALAQTQSDSMT